MNDFLATIGLTNIAEVIFKWQTLVGSAVGAVTPLFILWYAEWYKEKKEDEQYLYFLQRSIVDQINLVVEMRETIIIFLDSKISVLLNNIDSNPSSAYSVDGIFLPMFSVRSLPEEVNSRSSNSGYIDNKIGKIYAISKDLPHIVDDIRLQLKHTIEMNEKIAFGKLNSPEVQKDQYKRNVQDYEKVLKEDILGKNIPVYLKLLAQSLVAVKKKSNTKSFFWKIKFDPKYRFYITNKAYLRDREKIMEKLDQYFKSEVDELLIDIDKY